MGNYAEGGFVVGARVKRAISSKYFFIAVAFLVALFFVLLNSKNIIAQAKRWGGEQYYVKISSEAPTDNGQEYWKYTYQLGGYSSDGAKRLLRFDANRILRSSAYLRVYVRDDGAVITWEEVPPQDVPAVAQKYLN